MKNYAKKAYQTRVLQAHGKEIILGQRTLVMGILNVTPDSFSDGGRHNEVEAALAHAKKMLAEGADIIDVGGESTRPGAKEVSLEEEIQRVVPVIEALARETDAIISIDTYKAQVAEQAVAAGAHIINDVWGMQREPEIAQVAGRHKVPVIAMHNQKGTTYDGDILEAMKVFFQRTVAIAEGAGMRLDQLVLDPGIGFGKTPIQNVQVMGRLQELNELGYPVLLGTSRKSMIGAILDLPSDQRVEGTIATNVLGVMAGCEIIRVHDIVENRRAIRVADAIVRGWNG